MGDPRELGKGWQVIERTARLMRERRERGEVTGERITLETLGTYMTTMALAMKEQGTEVSLKRRTADNGWNPMVAYDLRWDPKGESNKRIYVQVYNRDDRLTSVGLRMGSREKVFIMYSDTSEGDIQTTPKEIEGKNREFRDMSVRQKLEYLRSFATTAYDINFDEPDNGRFRVDSAKFTWERLV